MVNQGNPCYSNNGMNRLVKRPTQPFVVVKYRNVDYSYNV